MVTGSAQQLSQPKLTDMELARQARLEENRRKMEELGLTATLEGLRAETEAEAEARHQVHTACGPTPFAERGSC